MIVGAGLGGLATAFYLQRADPSIDVTVVDPSDGAGGNTRSQRVNGFTMDMGPNGFLTNVPACLDLVVDLGLRDEILPASGVSDRRYVYRDGGLVALPLSPGELLRTPLLSPAGRLRFLREPLVAAAPNGREESMYDFAARRLGPEAAEAFVLPMVVGITAGDARHVSVDALFPRLRAMERDYGSITRALLVSRREARAHRSDSGPGGRLTTLRGGGIGRLTMALAERLGERLRLGVSAVTIQPGTPPWDRYRVSLSDGTTVGVDALVLAVPAHVAATLLRSMLPSLYNDLQAIPYASARVIALGYRRADIPRALDGFGFLVPRGQDVRILGCLWSSVVFPDQAPDGMVAIRVIGGGVDDPEFATLGDGAAMGYVRADLRRTMGIRAAPTVTRQFRWPRAIPQYTLGHGDRVARIMRVLRSSPGLALTGNAYYGVALNDVVRDAHRVVAELTGATSPRGLA